MDSKGATLLEELSASMADAVETAAASTVTVNARKRMPASGISWNGDGLVVTANHVVERDDDLHVSASDGTWVSATLVGRDPGSDTALLKVNADFSPPATLTDSPARPGQIVLAVGRPGNSGAMASLGVVSMVGGQWRSGDGAQLDSFLRTDAAMLPGFSGGPLISTSGAVIGMNSSSVGRRGSLTIPHSDLSRIVEALQTHGKIRRGYIGIGAQSVTLNNRLSSALGLENETGLVVVGLESDGPGEKAGLMIGDVILTLEGHPVAKVEDVQNLLTGELVGKPVTLRIVRGGALQHLDVTAAERR